MLTWLTSSRVADLIELTPQDFVWLTPRRLGIAFSFKTKTSHADPNRVDMFSSARPLRDRGSTCQAALRQAPFGAPVFQLEAAQMRNIMAKILGTKTYTAHSLKRGAASQITKIVSTNKKTRKQENKKNKKTRSYHETTPKHQPQRRKHRKMASLTESPTRHRQSRGCRM